MEVMDVSTNNIVMTTKKKSPYSFKVILDAIKTGLFLQGVRRGVAKICLDIMPYYWIKEEVNSTDEPQLRTAQSFIFKELNLVT